MLFRIGTPIRSHLAHKKQTNLFLRKVIRVWRARDDMPAATMLFQRCGVEVVDMELRSLYCQP